MEQKPLVVSVVIATLNSEQRLPATLQRLKDQILPAEVRLEILVVDGGSTDRTPQIATQFGAEVVPNPRVIPSWAKFLSLQRATGNIIVFLDSDEVYSDTMALANVVAAFRENPSVHMVTASGYICPKGYPFTNLYINEYGDPFSFFIYRLSKDYRYYMATMSERYVAARDTNAYSVFDLSQAKDLPLIEMYAMGAALDLDYFRARFPGQLKSEAEFAHAFNFMIEDSPYLAIAKKCEIYHYSAETLGKFLQKINWRIKNNVAIKEVGATGFSGRLKYQSGQTRWRRLAFLPYCLLIFPVFVDSLGLALRKRNLKYLLHTPLSLYTALAILYYFTRTRLGWKPTLTAYGSTAPRR